MLFLLRRDGFVCGAHVGGCGEEILYDDAVADSRYSTVDKDHILSKTFSKGHHREKELWNADWNLQPIHKRCGNLRQGSLDTNFTCNCHHCYVNSDDSVDMCYLSHGEWGKVSLFEQDQPVRNDVGGAWLKAGAAPSSHGSATGWGITEDGRMFGHIFPRPHPRELYNIGQLFRTGRWSMCRDECEEFRRNYPDTSVFTDSDIALFYTMEFLSDCFKDIGEIDRVINAIASGNTKSVVREIQKNINVQDRLNPLRYYSVRSGVFDCLNSHVRFWIEIGRVSAKG